MLNIFHMELVDYDDDFLMGTFVNLLEKILSSLVDKYSLEFWEEKISRLDEPVNVVWI